MPSLAAAIEIVTTMPVTDVNLGLPFVMFPTADCSTQSNQNLSDCDLDMQPTEAACDGNFRDNASLPEGPESMDINPGHPSELWASNPPSIGLTYPGPNIDNSSVTEFGSGNSPQDSFGMTTSQRSSYSATEETGCEYVYVEQGGSEDSDQMPYHFSSQPDQLDDKQDDNMTTRVLLGLDNILREKVNVQVEEFRGTISTLLDEQFHRIKHLIRLSSDLPHNQVKEEAQQATENQKCNDLGSACEDQERARAESELEKSQLLLQLSTYASSITNTLSRRQEFRLS